MKIKTSELIGPALDWAVAKCDGVECDENHTPIWFESNGLAAPRVSYSPSTDWAQGGPIIDRNHISTIRCDDEYETDAQGFTTTKRIPVWFAEGGGRFWGHGTRTSYEGEYMPPTFMIEEWDGIYGPTPLIAAMRCYVASKLGDEVDVPEELLK